MLFENIQQVEKLVVKWQEILRLQDWDISVFEVNKDWRKTGDIKIDSDDKRAVLMVNGYNPKSNNLESLVVHELMHLKLWGLDQTIEQLINIVFGEEETDPKRDYAMTKFMEILEPTVEDLAKSFMSLENSDQRPMDGRVLKQVESELA